MRNTSVSNHQSIGDPVADDAPGALEIGFSLQEHPNCSSILWDNLERNPDKLALIGPSGGLTYEALCAEAARWGNAFIAAGLKQGERIAMFLDDTPVYPAAFFGAVRRFCTGSVEYSDPVGCAQFLS